MKIMAPPPGLETRRFVLEQGALRQLPAIIREYWQCSSVWLVADDNTWQVGGEELSALLIGAGFAVLPPYIFPGTPTLHAEIDHAYLLIRQMPENAVPIVLGSGTLNDLLKYAAGQRGIPYIVVATAPSVDGYTASGAALVADGFKKTLPCPAPLAVLADPDLLATAPQPMFAAGYADLLAKIPAGADWIVADYLGVHPIRDDVWQMVQAPLREWLALPAAVERIFAGLMASGYAIQMCGDSRPASGAEHLISHIWEMDGVEASHGFKVGVATLATTLLYEKLLQLDGHALQKHARPGLTREERAREIEALTGKSGSAAAICGVALEKHLAGAALQKRRDLIYAGWNNLRMRIGEQMIMSHEIRRMLRSVNAPVSARQLGITRAQFIGALPRAQLIRKRHTVLDLAYELGFSLEQLASELYEAIDR